MTSTVTVHAFQALLVHKRSKFCYIREPQPPLNHKSSFIVRICRVWSITIYLQGSYHIKNKPVSDSVPMQKQDGVNSPAKTNYSLFVIPAHRTRAPYAGCVPL